MDKKWIAGFFVMALFLIGGLTTMAITSFNSEPSGSKETNNAVNSKERERSGEEGQKEGPNNQKDEAILSTQQPKDKEGLYEKEWVLEGKELTETEWSLLKANVLRLVGDGFAHEAVELLADLTYGVDRENLSFKDDLFSLEQDITIYMTIAERTGEGSGDMIGSEVAVELAGTMRDPDLALFTLFTMPHKERVQVLLHQQSLAPLFEGEPVYGKEVDYDGEYLNDIQMFYGEDAAIKRVDVTLEGHLLHAILVNDGGAWKVWRLIEAEETTTNYQSVEYWKEFFSKTNKVRKGEG